MQRVRQRLLAQHCETAKQRHGADLGMGLRDRHIDHCVRLDPVKQLLQRRGHRDIGEADVRRGAPGGVEVEISYADEPDVGRPADHVEPGAAHHARADLDQPDRLSW